MLCLDKVVRMNLKNRKKDKTQTIEFFYANAKKTSHKVEKDQLVMVQRIGFQNAGVLAGKRP